MKIDTKIAPPKTDKKGRQLRNVYPFADMEVGDSFLLKAKTPYRKDKTCVNVCTAIRQYTIKHKYKFQFTTRKVKEGIRVWRIK